MILLHRCISRKVAIIEAMHTRAESILRIYSLHGACSSVIIVVFIHGAHSLSTLLQKLFQNYRAENGWLKFF
jgi:hypothetical protein